MAQSHKVRTAYNRPAKTMAELLTGTVTFLFTDIEGSTDLTRRLGDRYAETLSEHNRLLRRAVADAEGREIGTQGDALFAVFARTRDAVRAAAAAQRALAAHAWPDGVAVRVRMGIHTGEPATGSDGYVGLDVVRAARICAAAHGGQVLVSETTRALLGEGLDGLALQDLGEHRLKDFDRAERLFQLTGAELPQSFPALRSESPEQLAALPGDLGSLTRRLDVTAGGLGAAIEQAVHENLRAQGIEPAAQRGGRGAVRTSERRGLTLPEVSPMMVLFGVLVALPIVWLILQSL